MYIKTVRTECHSNHLAYLITILCSCHKNAKCRVCMFACINIMMHACNTYSMLIMVDVLVISLIFVKATIVYVYFVHFIFQLYDTVDINGFSA